MSSDDADSWQRPTASKPACAECRRQKLRCDRKIPCSTCTRRHCEEVCPDGVVTDPKAHSRSRVLITESRYLLDKIDAMQKRLSELEVAIASLRARDESTNVAWEGARGPETRHSNDEAEDDLPSMFGTLTLGEQPQWLGRTALSDYLLDRRSSSNAAKPQGNFLPELDCAFLFTSHPAQDPEGLLASLPLRHVAYNLVKIFFHHIGWLLGAVSQDEVNKTLLLLYSDTGTRATSFPEGLAMHDLAVLFMIFAITYIADPGNNGRNVDETRRNYGLACLALSFDPLLERPTLQGIAAVHLICWLMYLSDDQNAMGIAYNLHGLSAQLCKSLGLHRDDSAWALDEDTKQSRRFLVWDMALAVVAIGINFGRPPAFTMSQFDARLPVDTEAFLDPATSEWQQSIQAWSHGFTSSCLLRVADQAFSPRAVSYATVLRLDQVIREHPVSPMLRTPNVGKFEPDIPVTLAMQRASVMIITNKLLLNLHRAFFAKAVSEGPDPTQSKYQQSVMAAFRAAFYITATLRTLYERVPAVVRFPHFWSPAFSACVVLVSVVIKCPTCSLASSAMGEFERTLAVFQRVKTESRTVARFMPTLVTLRDKATKSWAPAVQDDNLSRPELDEDEMAFIYGATRVVRAGTVTSGTDPANLRPEDSDYSALTPVSFQG
ncbi:hypothetical protein EXIGLDRAFT_773988 [Exidia glandulosa HHB12029]|uniref:Zn(2)-C6 fungal-type domain-containing protein n=1 Tax=Exidia glandulosa HHB12029 TaxID=1314781 RepID=A0A165EK95_EXIGL|nr:hypothetical protein EXIGLDRAFT_773988 [Exidia glandulosa HHB12029]